MIFKGSNLSWKALVLLFLIFSTSVFFRAPNIDRPLSKHHEFVTSVSLRVLQIWHVEGASQYNFVPVMNYGGEANKHINNHASPTKSMVDSKGNYYYVSHPPLAYMVPHFVFRAINVKPTVFSLQIFHLFINFFSAICVYLIVLSIRRRPRSGVDKTALIAFVIYTFSTAVLWFQCNTYMSDMFVHFFFLIGILLGLKCLSFPSSTKWKILFAINVFLMIYTSWLGVFFAFVIFVSGLTIWRKMGGVKLAVFTAISALLALVGIYFQYSSINGSEAFLDHLFQRLDVRGSGMGGREGNIVVTKIYEIGTLIFNYISNYLVVLLLILVVFSYANKKSIAKMSELKTFMALSLAPVILLHLVLLNYSGHDFTILYASCFLSIALAFLLESFADKIKYLVVTLSVVGSLGLYYFINPPGEYSLSGERYATSMELGEFIKAEAKADEVVYFVGDHLDPMTVVYAERNIVFVKLHRDAFEVLMEELPDRVVFSYKDGKIDVKRFPIIFEF